MSTVSVATGGKSHEEVLGIKMLEGAKLAIEEWNARGGYFRRHIPFELDVRNDNGLWGASGNEIINMAYKNEDWAILGTIDGANSHIAIRVALKAEIVMMNTGDTDPTFIETNIPWVMRCIGDDRQMGYLLMDYVLRKMNYKRIGIIRASNRYGRFGVREINDAARRHQQASPDRDGLPRRLRGLSVCNSSASRRPTPTPSSTGATPARARWSSTRCARWG